MTHREQDFMTDESFGKALRQLSAMLHERGLRRESFGWLFREDVALEGTLLLAHCDEADDGLVQSRFEHGLQRGAVIVSAIGIDAHRVYCALYVPRDASDAASRLASGATLKIQIPLLHVQRADRVVIQRRATAETLEQRSLLDDLFARRGAPSE